MLWVSSSRIRWHRIGSLMPVVRIRTVASLMLWSPRQLTEKKPSLPWTYRLSRDRNRVTGAKCSLMSAPAGSSTRRRSVVVVSALKSVTTFFRQVRLAAVTLPSTWTSTTASAHFVTTRMSSPYSAPRAMSVKYASVALATFGLRTGAAATDGGADETTGPGDDGKEVTGGGAESQPARAVVSSSRAQTAERFTCHILRPHPTSPRSGLRHPLVPEPA